MKHIYFVDPLKHQPQWPANDNEPNFKIGQKDHILAAMLFTLLAIVVLGVAVVGLS